MLIQRSLIGLLSLLIASLICESQPNTRLATVHIVLVDSRGDDLGIGTISSFQEQTEGSPEFRSRFTGNAASDIPFGTYHLRAFANHYSSVDRTVLVRQKDVWIVAQLNVSEENGPTRYTIAGSIQAVPPVTHDLWARAQGLYSDVIADTRVERTGKFQIAGLPSGIYILSTRQGNRILDIRSMTLPPPGYKEGTPIQVLVTIKQ
jgi:hypothetical protein